MGEALRGRVAIITGAAGGLGAEYARLFAAEGTRLVLADRQPSSEPGHVDPLTSLVGELVSHGAEVAEYRGDVGAEQSADGMVDVALERFGGLDIVVNNAGNWYDGEIVDTPVEALDAILHVHLRGHFLMLRAAARYWVRTCRSGRPVRAAVINTTSRSALNGIAGHAVYAAAKGGIIALTHVAANELAEYGVRVNCVAPAGRTGMTLGITSLADAIRAPDDASFDEWDPAHVAPLVAYLATEACPLTGEILFARGGTVQRYPRLLPGAVIEQPARWTIDELASLVPSLVADADGDVDR
jgi:NAD(P)-dependent dehydrogenase (short-subunit alcohol dehydrogenase family)